MMVCVHEVKTNLGGRGQMWTFYRMEDAAALVIFLVVVAILRLVFFRGPIGKSVSEPPVGIIDMHCHTAGFGAGESGAWVSKELRASWKFKLYLKISGSNVSEMEREGDEVIMKIIAKSLEEAKFVDGAVILGNITIQFQHFTGFLTRTQAHQYKGPCARQRLFLPIFGNQIARKIKHALLIISFCEGLNIFETNSGCQTKMGRQAENIFCKGRVVIVGKCKI